MTKTMTILAATALAALGVAACERKNDTRPSDTNTTSAPYDRGTTTTGDTAGSPVPETPPGVDTRDTESRLYEERKDGGHVTGTTTVTGADTASRGGDTSDVDKWGIEKKDGGHVTTGGSKAKSGERNTSTSLGDGTSGESTGGKGTYGGKATWGTGEKNKDAGH